MPYMDVDGQPNLGSVTEAAARSGLSEKTIRRYLKNGRLTEYRLGIKLLRVDLDEIADLVRPIGRAS